MLAQIIGMTVAGEDADRVRFLEPPLLRAMVFQAAAVWLEALAAEQPTVLALDDIHWIDPTSLDLLQALLPLTSRVPLLVLLAFRPRPGDPSWSFHEAAGREYAEQYRAIALNPLDTSQARQLVRNLLTIEDLPESVRRLILDKSEGNPFFLEEVIRSLLDAGLVVRQEDHWRATAEIIDLSIPNTLNGVITARLDRLADADRQVIQAAAVLGREFSRDVLADLLDDSASLDAGLATLKQRELIRAGATGRFSFKHVLTQEAAYDSLLLSRRRQLHHHAADIISRLEPERAAEIARHYLEARQPGQALPHLVRAGQQAAHGYAIPEATGLYEQALAHEALGDTVNVRAAYEGLGNLYSMGDPARAASIYERMLNVAEQRGDTPMIISALNKLSSVFALMMGQYEKAEAYLNRAERLSQNDSDVDGFAELSIIRCQMCTMQADFDSVIRYMDGVIEGSMQTGNDHNLLMGLGHSAHSLMSLGRFDDAWQKAIGTWTLARQIGDRAHEADMLTYPIPWVQIRNGDLDGALESVQEGLALARRITSLASVSQGEWAAAEIYRLRGEYESALAAGRRAVEAATPLESFMTFYMVMSLGTLGSIYLELSEMFTDRIAELHRHALRLLDTPMGAVGGASGWAGLGWCALTLGDVTMAEEMFTRGMATPGIMTRMEMPRFLTGMALVHLSRGDTKAAMRRAEEACVFVAEHQMKNMEPLTHLTLGRVLVETGAHEAALDEFMSAARGARAMALRPMLWTAQTATACALRSLGRDVEADQATDESRTTIDDIAGLIHDPELNAAYRQSATRRMAAIMQP